MILGKAADVAAAASTGPAAAAKSAKGPRPESLTIAPNFFATTGLWPVVNGGPRAIHDYECHPPTPSIHSSMRPSQNPMRNWRA